MSKQLVDKAKVNFKIYDDADWETNNYNAHIAQHLQNLKQSHTKIWSVNRIKHEKYFSRKITHKLWW